ncbi:4,5-dihydroxyphthalate decarboxylase [Alkalihalobacillus oceani]|uniref:4,5-dihydroxyphthalate decarboxylase n=1 Tax=Halalkalibacter oceani TaxID=1653776 RepID=UPI00203F7717|nr:4,5-dihydroxyphthalate decarboxylase [Halalkalibacter oceani]MCM3760062.1 4,5-dihydroxyphthalate decarboxylase [Halalkalibacter oceani]
MKKTLSLAVSKSDRTQSIISGQAALADYDLELKSTMVEEIFEKQVSEASYDIAEMSLASYLIGLSKGETRLTAIPVFLSRSFRHNAIYVRSDAPWQHPSELKGRRFGVPEYQMTAAVWVRAYFRHEWNVATEELNWVTYRPERIPVDTPAERAESGDIFKALVDGEVDAIMTARRPPAEYFSLSGEGGEIRRLIPDVWTVERDYYERTGIFPIMHLVSLRKEAVENDPQLAKQVYELFLKEKQQAQLRLFETVKNETSAPFLWEAAERSAKLLGDDIWPYGLKRNWAQIESFMQYLKEDGLISRTFTKDEVFDSSLLDT